MEYLEQDEYSLFRPESVLHAQSRSRGTARLYLPPSVLATSVAAAASAIATPSTTVASVARVGWNRSRINILIAF